MKAKILITLLIVFISSLSFAGSCFENVLPRGAKNAVMLESDDSWGYFTLDGQRYLMFCESSIMASRGFFGITAIPKPIDLENPDEFKHILELLEALEKIREKGP